MGDLYPTPTRLELLRDVREGRIRRIQPNYGDPRVLNLDDRHVTARVAELEQAGWVEPNPEDIEETFDFQIQHYHLTDEGRKVLSGG